MAFDAPRRQRSLLWDGLTVFLWACCLIGMALWIVLLVNERITEERPHCGFLSSYGFELCLEQGQCCVKGGCNATSPGAFPSCIEMQINEVETKEFLLVFFLIVCSAFASFFAALKSQYQGSLLPIVGPLCGVVFLVWALFWFLCHQLLGKYQEQ
jgi:hypothetical protein